MIPEASGYVLSEYWNHTFLNLSFSATEAQTYGSDWLNMTAVSAVSDGLK